MRGCYLNLNIPAIKHLKAAFQDTINHATNGKLNRIFGGLLTSHNRMSFTAREWAQSILSRHLFTQLVKIEVIHVFATHSSGSLHVVFIRPL